MIKWIVKKKVRIIWVLSLVGLLVLGISINKVFFEKMEFVQSEVYPDLFLVKHPIDDKDSLNELIKNKIILEMNPQFNLKTDMDIMNKHQKIFRFYTYTTAWGFSNGTVHFLENKEDPGGFSSEEINNYQEHKLAYFSFRKCKNDSTHYFGNLSLFKDGVLDSTEILINTCNK